MKALSFVSFENLYICLVPYFKPCIVMLVNVIFIVISQKVNMAARLMLKFPDAVTCDETTKIKSKLPEEDFVEQPPVVLKGIADTGAIFAYSTVKYVCNICLCTWCVCVCAYVCVCVRACVHVRACT